MAHFLIGLAPFIVGISVSTLFSLSIFVGGEAKATIICTGECSFSPQVSVASPENSSGTLDISSGSVIDTPDFDAHIGFSNNATGEVMVDGSGTELKIGGGAGNTMSVGQNGGTGALNVQNSGKVTISTNALNAFPSASIFVGLGGNGTVNVNSGGNLTVQNNTGGPQNLDGMILGFSSPTGPGTGVLNLAGEGSSVNLIGEGVFFSAAASNTPFTGTGIANAAINITNGADLVIDGGNDFGAIVLAEGGNATGVATITGSGTTVNVTGNSGFLLVASDANGPVTGQATGILTISDSAVVNITGTVAGSSEILIGNGLGNGLVNVNTGASLSVDGSLEVSTDSMAGNTDHTGTLIINDTATVTAIDTLVGNNGVIAGTGTLISNTTTVEPGGTIQAGTSPGVLNIIGDLILDGGQLVIEVGGLGAGEFDIINITGIVDLIAGEIFFEFIDGFLPQTNNSFEFLSATGGSTLGTGVSFGFGGATQAFEFEVNSANGAFGFTALNDAIATPEPSTVALLSIALAGFARACRRSRNRTLYRVYSE